MLPKHKEQFLAHKLDGQNSVSTLKDRLEEKSFFAERSLREETFLNDQLFAIRHQLILPLCLACQSLGVRVVSDDLCRVLPKVGNLSLKGLLFLPFLNLIQVDTIFVCEWVENVHIFNGILSSLFVAVNQINPVVDVLRHIPTL